MSLAAERFLRYVSFNTQSDEAASCCPSTIGQREFGNYLVKEMLAIGINDAFMDENGYIYGTVPGDKEMPVIGLIAHMDTAPDASGENIQARVAKYDGNDICLNSEKDIYLRAEDYPRLQLYQGKQLIVTDGTTLLGADDKAGIAEILTAAEILLHSDTPHATLRIGFTPDEEIGRGADRFDIGIFSADYAYTVDGGMIGEMEYECFNAAAAEVTVTGLNIHPGAAKDKMVNSMLIAMEYNALLPVQQRPEYTSGYEGFIMLHGMEGEVEKTTLRYIIRDHDSVKFEEKKHLMLSAADFLNAKYADGTVSVELKDSYRNMREKIESVMYIVDRAKKAMAKAGMEPSTAPIRGGTDGASLSYRGLPCPNLCTGGENAHSRFEYIAVEDMDACVDMLTALLTDPGLKQSDL